MLRSLFVVSLAVIVVLSGCQASTKPKTVSAMEPQQRKLKLREAPFNGKYELFEAQSDSREGTTLVGEPLASEQLRRGERLGFRREGDELYAVAGAKEIPIGTGQYAWQMRADKGQIDGSKTVAFVVLVAAVTALALQVAFVASF